MKMIIFRQQGWIYIIMMLWAISFIHFFSSMIRPLFNLEMSYYLDTLEWWRSWVSRSTQDTPCHQITHTIVLIRVLSRRNSTQNFCLHGSVLWSWTHQNSGDLKACAPPLHFSTAPAIRQSIVPGISLGMGSANERRRYNVTSSLIGWAQTQNNLLERRQ